MDMKQSGCSMSDIKSARFARLETSYGKSIVDGLAHSKIQYSAKYSDEKIVLAFPAEQENKVRSILKKAESDSAEFVERMRHESGSTDEYISLIPEIAEIMSVSASSLENRPAEIRLFLAQAYVDNWFCDITTIREELNKVTELGYYAQNEVESVQREKSAQNNTPEQRKDIHDSDVRLEQAAAQERFELRQQRDNTVKEENRTFNLAMLNREIERIRHTPSQSHQKSREIQNDVVLKRK